MNKKKLGELFYLVILFIFLFFTILFEILLPIFVMIEKNYYKIALCAFGFYMSFTLLYFFSTKFVNKITIFKITNSENRIFYIKIFIIIYTIIILLLYLFRILPDFPKEGITPS